MEEMICVVASDKAFGADGGGRLADTHCILIEQLTMSRSQLGKGRSLQAGEALFRRRDFRWITTEDRVYAEFRDRRAYSVCVDGLESRLVCRRLNDAVVSEGHNSVSVFRV